jgi:hypothetical protein
MQSYPPAPPNPIFGILTWGLVLISIYVFARLASEGEGCYYGCKRAITVGILGMVIISLYEPLNYWNQTLQTPVDYANPLLVWGGLMMIGFLIIIIPLIDLAVQRYRLKKD